MFEVNTIKQFQKKLSKAGRGLLRVNIPKELKILFDESGISARSDIIKSMRGTPKASYFYLRGGKKHHPSIAGNPPAIDTGNLIGSISHNVMGTSMEIGSRIVDKKYPMWLEEGTQNMKSRPWLRPAWNREEPKLVKNIANIVPDVMDRIFKDVSKG